MRNNCYTKTEKKTTPRGKYCDVTKKNSRYKHDTNVLIINDDLFLAHSFALCIFLHYNRCKFSEYICKLAAHDISRQGNFRKNSCLTTYKSLHVYLNLLRN